MPFSSLINAYSGIRPSTCDYDSKETQRAKTQETRRHRHEFKTFEEVFLTEVAGGLDENEQMLEDAIIHLFEAATGKRPTEQEVELSRTSHFNLSDLIYSLFASGKAGVNLPGIRILSGIHAAIRYRDQPYKKGDLWDRLHARVALPYCNAFLTEKNLANLLTQTPLMYAVLYGFRIIWQDEDVLSFLNTV